MPDIPFPNGLSGVAKLPKTQTLLQNCFNNKAGQIIGRPGILGLAEFAGVEARGGLNWDGALYEVYGNTLYRSEDPDSGVFTTVGTISGSERVFGQAGEPYAVLVVKDDVTYSLGRASSAIPITGVSNVSGIASFEFLGNVTPTVGATVTIAGFVTQTTYNGTGTVTASEDNAIEVDSIAFTGTETVGTLNIVLDEISQNANFEPFNSVTVIQGRFVYTTTSGIGAKFSDLNAPGVIDTFSFVDAASSQDTTNVAINLGDRLYLGGTDTFEPFLNTGALPNPFSPIPGGRVDVGYIGGMLEYNKTFLFIGRDKGQSFGVYSITPGNALKVSNEAVDEILGTYTLAELGEAIPGRIFFHGYDLATFQLRNHSFGYYAGSWFRVDTQFEGVASPWGAGYITQFGGKYYTAFSTLFGAFEEINTDYLNPINKILEFGFKVADNKWFSMSALRFGISQGFNKRINVAITSVESGTGGLAQFNFTPALNTKVAVGQEATIVGYVTNTAYNVTGLISETDGESYIVIASVSFGTDEEVGTFTTPALSSGSVALQTSRNGVDFNDPVFKKLGALGQYAKIARWSGMGGVGRFEGFGKFRIFTSENVTFSADGISADIK
jgi:hypothetical protein